MRVEFFDVSDGGVVLNEHCLLVPEVRAVVDRFMDSGYLFDVLSWLYYTYDPFSPYGNMEESDKREVLYADFCGGRWDIGCSEVVAAGRKLEKMYMSSTRRFFLDAKLGLEKLGAYLRDNDPHAGMGGNLSQYSSILSKVGKMIQEYKALERLNDEELSSVRVRGGKQLSYDEDDD